MPKHAAAKKKIASVYNKGAFVGVINVQFNSIKIQGINHVQTCSTQLGNITYNKMIAVFEGLFCLPKSAPFKNNKFVYLYSN
jgi:hypothetical protein